MSLEVYNESVVWSGNQIGAIEGTVARLYLTMEDFVNNEFKFHEVCDVVAHFDEIVAQLVRKGYQVEGDVVPDQSLGAMKKSYDAWYKMIYG